MEKSRVYPAELARRLGMSQPAIHNYAGGRIPRAEELAQIAGFF